MVWTVLSWVMSFVALIGTIINAERNRWGFAFWAVSNAYMTVRFFVIGEYAQSALFFVYLILAFRGLISWKIREKSDKENACKIEKINRYINDNIKRFEKAKDNNLD